MKTNPPRFLLKALQLSSALFLSLTLLGSAASAAKTLLKVNNKGNSLVIKSDEGEKNCTTSQFECVKVILNGKVMHEGFHADIEYNAIYPDKKSPSVIIITTSTGGNGIVSDTTLIDLAKPNGYVTSFLSNFSGHIDVSEISNSRLSLTGTFEEDELGDPTPKVLIYDRLSGNIFFKPSAGRIDYSDFIGLLPSKLLSDKAAREDILHSLGPDYFKKLRELSGLSSPFSGKNSYAVKWSIAKGCKPHQCNINDSLVLLNIEDSEAVVLLMETIANKPFFSLWSTGELSKSDLEDISFDLNNWLEERGAKFEPALGLRVFVVR